MLFAAQLIGFEECLIKKGDLRPDRKLLIGQDEKHPETLEEGKEIDQSVDFFLDSLIADNQSIAASSRAPPSTIASIGKDAIRKYGLGPCSARWFYGSFDAFITLERTIANLYPSLVRQAGRCRGSSSFE